MENKTLLESRGVDVIEFPISNWNDRRMTCKVEKAYQLIEDLPCRTVITKANPIKHITFVLTGKH